MTWVQGQVAAGRGLWLALLVMLVLTLPGFFTLPPVDRDEVLFSQASRQMVQSGDVIDIHFGDANRYKKPVGIYWLQAAVTSVVGHGDQIWTYRLVSLMAALAAVGLTHAIANLFLTEEAAFLSAIALATSLMLGAEAHLAKTDATLLATICAAHYVLARLLHRDGLRFGHAMLFWAALGVSLLIKGPIGPMVAGFSVGLICLWRRDLALWRALRPLPGLALLLAISAPWYIAITFVSQGAFWSASLGADMIEKLTGAKESHGAPPGSYLAAIWLTFWPAAMPLAASLPVIWRHRRTKLVIFALIWLVPTWLVFEATPTKLVHYTLPIYPALALLVGYAVQVTEAQQNAGQPGVGQMWRWPVPLAGLLPLLLLAALIWQAGEIGATMPLGFWLAGVLVLVSLWLVWRAQTAVPLAVALALGGLAMNAAVYPTLAGIDELWPAKPLASFASAHPGCAFAVAGFAEPSLVFLTDNRVDFVKVEDLTGLLTTPGCHLLAAPGEAPESGLQDLGRAQGLDLGTGRKVDLGVWLKP